MNTLKTLVSVGIVALSLASWSTQAAITKTTLCAVAEATVDPAETVADDCVGFLQGSSGGEVNYDDSELNTDLVDPLHTSVNNVAWTPGAFGHNDWYNVAKRDKGKNNALPFGFEVTGPVAGTISWTTTTGLNGEWIVLVKQAKIVVMYLFQNLSSTTEGTVNLNNLPANAGDWSHVSLLSRGGTPPDQNVPAPATLLLMGAGLASIGISRRRRRPA